MTFSKILIANRGEIACRIIRTARSSGYATVAVFSEADYQARHVALADMAVALPGSAVQHTYLHAERILQAALQSGAQAIHPGYGFLSENAEFARACQAAGLVFIGPDPEAMALMGSKRQAKIAMMAAGVPCVPGYEGGEQTDERFINEAQRIGYPVMIKASAGGGGRGMRKVDAPEHLQESLQTARSEARHAFGNDELILEKAVIDPRHVEIQIFADRQGHCIYLGERDCSIQRRHQKVVEEAPCPVMTPALRHQMGSAAVAAAQSCHYVGAGTVEFLLDSNGAFYFLEMNTRLQVEHPVTEMITGLDLVDWQLRIAAGEDLPLTQEQVQLRGHAIEVRFYAEDPAQEFLPQTGPIDYFATACGESIRTDHGIVQDTQVSAFYDPMLAKIIAWGESRQEACRRLTRAVEETHLAGVPHNQGFLLDVLRHPAFINGHTHTGFINEHLSTAVSLRPPAATASDFAMAALLALPQSTWQSGWRSGADLPSLIVLQQDTRQETIHIQAGESGRFTLRLTDHETLCQVIERQTHVLIYQIGSLRQRLHYHVQPSAQRIDLFGHQGVISFYNISHRRSQSNLVQGSGSLTAPMDGQISSIRVSVGQRVERGTVLMILEAMKMEHPIRADREGVVVSISVSNATQVKKRQLLITLGEESPAPLKSAT